MQRDYSPVQTSPTQALSDDNSSDSDGLLKEEKTFQLQGHRKTFWRRHAVIICGHLCVFVLYTTIVQVLIAACWRWQMLLGTSPKSLLYCTPQLLIARVLPSSFTANLHQLLPTKPFTGSFTVSTQVTVMKGRIQVTRGMISTKLGRTSLGVCQVVVPNVISTLIQAFP